ncbi:MAG: hypothetical protein FJX59_14060 [Alphaproteobacteria bacterium]|nr:hypothetical protein [Alphaproteobacteria bacterium]
MSLRPLYARPRTLAEAAAVLSEIKSGAVVVAGGQDIMPHINYGRLMPAVVVDVGTISELRGIASDGDGLAIGALTTHRELRSHASVVRHAPLLAAGAGEIGGGWQVHNRGTIGGNIAALHPLYDIVPALLALGAEAEVHDDQGTHRMPVDKIVSNTGLGLGTRSVLARLHLRASPPGGGWGYRKLKATAGAYGSANAAAVVTLNKGEISSLRVVIGGASALPVDASAVAARAVGQRWSDRLGDEIETACRELIKQPLSDQQGEGSWRRAMAGVMARRAVQDAIARVAA